VNVAVVETSTELYALYGSVCRQIGFDDDLCQKNGAPITSWATYRYTHWAEMWAQWKEGICERLTIPKKVLRSRISPQAGKNAMTAGSDMFWRHFGTKNVTTNMATTTSTSARVVVVPSSSQRAWEHIPREGPLSPLGRERLVKHTGILIDFSLDSETSQ
jgi:hypothetical protein